MFGLFNTRKKKVQKAAAVVSDLMLITLSHLREGPIADDILDKVVETPYLTGFIQGQLAVPLYTLVTTNDLHEDDANAVSGIVLGYLLGTGKAKILSTAANRNSAARSSDWRLGFDRGSKIGKYMTGILDIKNEPEFANALSRAKVLKDEYNQVFPENPINDADEKKQAELGLVAIWFFDKLNH